MLQQWSLYDVIVDILPFVLNTKRPLSDIWLLRYKQNSFGCFREKSQFQFFPKTPKIVLLITQQPNIAQRPFCIQNEWLDNCWIGIVLTLSLWANFKISKVVKKFAFFDFFASASPPKLIILDIKDVTWSKKFVWTSILRQKLTSYQLLNWVIVADIG